MDNLTRISPLSRERGFTIWSVAFYALVLGGVLVLALRIAPNYLTYNTVKDIVGRAAAEHDPRTETMQDIRTRIRKLLTTSQIYAISVDDIEIYRDRGKIIIDASYEVRFPMFWIVEGVMVFDDLVFEAAGSGST